MEKNKTTYLSIFRLGKRTLVIFAVCGLVLALVVSITQPLEYRSQASVLVIPKARANIDGYQATRSAEKYALTLSSVIPTMSFYNKVVVANPEIASLFPKEEEKQREKWQKDMQASVVPETGILNLSAYSRKRDNAQKILFAAINVLEKEGPAYLGGTSAALIYMIDTPIASSLPVRPNYPLNILGGIIVGLLVGSVIVFVRSESFIAREELEEEPMVAPEEPEIKEEEFKLDELEISPPEKQILEKPQEEKKWYPKIDDLDINESEAQSASYIEQLNPWVTLRQKRK